MYAILNIEIVINSPFLASDCPSPSVGVVLAALEDAGVIFLAGKAFPLGPVNPPDFPFVFSTCTPLADSEKRELSRVHFIWCKINTN